MKVYTTFQICDELDLAKESIREWIGRKFIEPSIQMAQGRGTKSLFSQEDFDQIKIFIKLLRFGFSRKKASELSKKIASGATEIELDPFVTLHYKPTTTKRSGK